MFDNRFLCSMGEIPTKLGFGLRLYLNLNTSMANVTTDPSLFCEMCSRLCRVPTPHILHVSRWLSTEQERSICTFRLFLNHYVIDLYNILHIQGCYIYIGTAHGCTRLFKAIGNDILCIKFPNVSNSGFYLSNHL